MKKTNIMIVMMALVVLALGAYSVNAQASSNAQEAAIAVGDPGNYTAVTSTAGSNLAMGGNVTELNASRDANTQKWQGYFGEVEARLVIGVQSDIFFNFANNAGNNASAVSGLFASANQNFEFADISNMTYGQQVDEGFANFNVSDTDSANKTLNTGISVAGLQSVGTTFAGGVFGMAAYDDGTVGIGDAGTELNYTFGANVSVDATDFQSLTSDYQLMVPVNLTSQNPDVPRSLTYYFFMVVE